MLEDKIRKIIQQGEGINVEFKRCRNNVPRDVYKTICAFLNRMGGYVFLGVEDNGTISGVSPDSLEKIKIDITTVLNNPEKINPPLYIIPETYKINEAIILFLSIPEGSQVYRCNGKIYDRNEDGDLDITNHGESVYQLYIRKQSTFSENRIFPYLKISDLRSDLIQRIRNMVKSVNPNHPWRTLNDQELLKSAQLYNRDYQSGREGYTLAAILLLGKDEVIGSILPQYRTDAILRVYDLDRCDDRDDIRTNLIETYDRLMAFIAKHLPDSFYLERDQRVSLRDRIFREVISNLCIHREYLDAFPAKLIIEKKHVKTENGNRPHGHGMIRPDDFTPYPKNPTIARLFKEIGRADELGSGIRNLYKYTKNYSNGLDPELIENNIFRTVIPLPQIAFTTEKIDITEQATEQVTEQATEQAHILNVDINLNNKIIKFCQQPRTTKEIMNHLGLKHREYFRSKILNPLVEKRIIKLLYPDKPKSPKQKYYSAKQIKHESK